MLKAMSCSARQRNDATLADLVRSILEIQSGSFPSVRSIVNAEFGLRVVGFMDVDPIVALFGAELKLCNRGGNFCVDRGSLSSLSASDSANASNGSAAVDCESLWFGGISKLYLGNKYSSLAERAYSSQTKACCPRQYLQTPDVA